MPSMLMVTSTNHQVRMIDHVRRAGDVKSLNAICYLVCDSADGFLCLGERRGVNPPVSCLYPPVHTGRSPKPSFLPE